MRVVVSQFEGIDVTPALPLAAGCLVATARADAELARSARFAITVARQPIAAAVADLDRPDVLGVSLYPWNSAYSLAVAEAARAAHPDCLIVAGGPAVPRRPERARRLLDANPAIDVLVFSEGEFAFRRVLGAYRAGSGFDDIGGVAIAGRGGVEHRFTSPPGRIHDFTATASPFLDGTFDELLERDRGRFSMALFETNRGCPFSCTFCDWSLTKRVVELPIDRVHAELDWAISRDFTHIMFADANFGIRPRDTSIARYVASLRERTGRPAAFYFYLTKNNHRRNLETIEILQQAEIGCWVGLAVQDFDDQVLATVKRDNIHTHESMELRRICGERGIPTHNELIFGLPGQTYDSFTQTVATAMSGLPRHDFVFYLCRLIDNTELGEPESRERFALETRRCAWKTSTRDWDPIIDEIQEVVVGTRDLPVADWKRAYRFTFFAAALYNLRLYRVVLHHVSDLGGGRRDYIEYLTERLCDAPVGSVFAELGAIADRYVASILACGPFVLPALGGGKPAPVDEAIARVALLRYDDFLVEAEAHTRNFFAVADADLGDSLAEAFRYQSLITPRWGREEAVVAELEHDWPTYIAAGGTGAALVCGPTVVRFVPPVYTTVSTFAAFATTQLSCIRARLDIGSVEPVQPARRPAQLVVL